MVKSADTQDKNHLKSASGRSERGEKVLDNADEADEDLQGSDDSDDQPLVSGANHQNRRMTGTDGTVQVAPISSTNNTDSPIKKIHRFGGGGGDEFGRRVIYAADPTSIRVGPRLPLSHFTNQISPRLQWTDELHNRFIKALAELGGPDKVTPKTVREAMAVDDLTLVHVKSHLQKYRTGHLMVKKDLCEPRQNSAGRVFCASTSKKEPSHENGADQENRSKVKIEKTPKKKKCCPTPGELYQQVQTGKAVQNTQQTVKKCTEVARKNRGKRDAKDHQYKSAIEKHQNVGKTMFGQDLSSFENMATESMTTPLYSNQQEPYYNTYNSLEKMEEFIGLEKEFNSTVFASNQQPDEVVNVADYSAEDGGGFMTLTAYSFPDSASNSTTSDINNVQVGLQDQLPDFQNQDGVCNFQSGNEAVMVEPEQNDGDFENTESWNEFLNLESCQNEPDSLQEPQTATYTVQAQNANDSFSSCAANGIPVSNANASSMSNANASSSTSADTSLPKSKAGFSETACLEYDFIATLDSIEMNMPATMEEEPWETFTTYDISELDVSDCLDFSKPFEFPGQP